MIPFNETKVSLLYKELNSENLSNVYATGYIYYIFIAS